MVANTQCDLLIDYFNGTLTEQALKSFEDHLKECLTCNEELTELHTLTVDLPYLSEPYIPPKGMKEYVFSKVQSDVIAENDVTSSENARRRLSFPRKSGNRRRGKKFGGED